MAPDELVNAVKKVMLGKKYISASVAEKLAATLDPAERGTISKQLNDMLTKDSMTIVPLVHRGTLSAHSNTLGGVAINAWDTELWNTADWFRVK